MLRFGCVTSEISRVAPLAEMGYDYVELGAQTLRPLEGDAEFGAVRERLLAAPLRSEVLVSLIPPITGLRVVGPGVDRTQLRTYVQTVVRRAAEVGVQTIVFGSGAARKLPEGFPTRKAHAQLQDFVKLAGDLAAERNIVLAVEVLNRAETSLVTTIDEAVELVRTVNRPSVRIAVDYYHLLADEVPLDSLEMARGLIAHVHTADAGRWPPGSTRTDQRAFLRQLQTIGYTGRLSVECRFTNFAHEAPAALRHLRALWSELALAGAGSEASR